MKTKISLFTLFLILTNTLQLRAYDFEVDGIYYNYIQGTDNEVEVTNNGDNYYYISAYNGDVIIPSVVFYSDSSYKVTRIGDNAFSCSFISSIEIPNSITNIGYYAFASCFGLTAITIPQSVEHIGSFVFSQCIGLKSITVKWDTPIGIYDQFCLASGDQFCKNMADSCLLIVPRGSEALYRNARGWQNFKIIISDIYLYSYEDTLSFTSSKTDSIDIHSNISWTASCAADWITVLPKSGNGDTKLMVSVSANNSIKPRFSEIIVSGEGVEDWIIQVSQQAGYSPGWEYVRSIDNVGNSNDPMNKVYAQGENNVYLVGEKGYIAKSTDNALTWNKQYFPTQETFNDIVFCNDELGFIVGNNGTILRTEDAGENWTQLNSGTTLNINAIAATSENNIWVVGNGGLIMQSIDAGENWIIRNYTDNRNLYDVKFQNDTGYIVGDRNEVICVQNREGLPPYWWLQNAYTNPDEYDKITSLSITDSKVYALVKREGYGNDMIVYTSDNENWSVFNLNLGGNYSPIGYITQIFFQNDYVAYLTYIPPATTGIVSDSYAFVLIVTTDGGETWDYLGLPRDAFYMGGGYSEKVDFSFSKDNKYGYLASGTALLRTPYTGNFYVGVPNIKFDKSNLILKQQGNYLLVSAASRTIASVEIISVEGVKLLQVDKSNIDISSLSKGVYLIRAQFTDKTSETIKWIKN